MCATSRSTESGTSGTKFPKGDTVNDGIVEARSGDVGVLRVWDHPHAGLVLVADHDLGIDEVFRTTERDEADGDHAGK